MKMVSSIFFASLVALNASQLVKQLLTSLLPNPFSGCRADPKFNALFCSILTIK